MTQHATAYWVVARATGVLREETLADAGANEVCVRARASAVSRGTEALVFNGRVPESEHERMRCPFQVGSFPWPVKYGYAAVGVVEAGAPELIGKRVFCLHPHQDRFVVPARAVTLVPDDVTDQRATLCANLETALNALWDSGLYDEAPLRPGAAVAVIGAGTVGLMAALLARTVAHATVELIEPDEERARLARSLGFPVAAAPSQARDADVVFETSGRADGLVAALGIAAFEGTIVVMSWFGDQPVTLPLGGAFHARRLTIKSSQVGAVSPIVRDRITSAQRLQRALAVLADPQFDLLLREPIQFASMPAAMIEYFARPATPPAAIISYPD